jgi:hypothetical protein
MGRSMEPLACFDWNGQSRKLRSKPGWVGVAVHISGCVLVFVCVFNCFAAGATRNEIGAQ